MLNSLVKGVYRHMPDALYHRLKYAMFFRKVPHLARPVYYSEKLMRRKVYPQRIFTRLSDKYQVRDYIAKLWGEEYLIELYAHGEKLTQEMFDALPNAFVIKANHGSGYNKLVFDKSQTSFAELQALTRDWLRQNFYQVYRERHYKDIPPRIMVERMLQEDGKVPNDIKIHCFNRGGQIRFFIQVDYQRFSHHQRDFFDENWNRTEIRMGVPNSATPMARPSQLTKMLELTRQVAQRFSYVRVDFYQVHERVYFGELTFTPGAGLQRLTPETIEREWGSYFLD
ncbi:glycosyltransferase [Affinibrenneria salicis]|uniref:Glycosyltransferase n=1 Tax=Affinibrenneria salicis TaxID=2590031 RepID=A0A5J5FUM7_9GAMM|nr:ATP-grasp fold amidoligase family protein [Affinibrenneria salicis]KAA8996986.1 glycosyltransferase [Affinibrenneria salicis]